MDKGACWATVHEVTKSSMQQSVGHTYSPTPPPRPRHTQSVLIPEGKWYKNVNVGSLRMQRKMRQARGWIREGVLEGLALELTRWRFGKKMMRQ